MWNVAIPFAGQLVSIALDGKNIDGIYFYVAIPFAGQLVSILKS